MKLNIASIVVASLLSTQVQAVYVTPSLGGGEDPGVMVMPRVKLTGTVLSVPSIDSTLVGDPVLKPLTLPNEFDPTKPYVVLQNKSYNREYGWFMHDDSDLVPTGRWIWIESVNQSPGLESYAAMTYAPIFGTSGSSTKWQWSGGMAHNAYAVAPQIASWFATYRLYIGDSAGTEDTAYTPTSITLNWTSVPEPGMLGFAGFLGIGFLRRNRK